ncbi:MAG: hypothetical protein M1828_005944 [Chrysothrix sp. TS-e1954]|nr:MAG: hypothetical protein M1828_005944 [Chrysothrix sp. TS-e1954]
MDDVAHLVAGYAQKPATGCWTCKVRRKKCDGVATICNACIALRITCYYDQAKPSWMDGGARQEEMAQFFKNKVKENAHRRRAERSVAASSYPVSPSPTEASASNGEWLVLPSRPPHNSDPSSSNRPIHGQAVADMTNIHTRSPSANPAPSTGRKDECVFHANTSLESPPLGRADTIRITFYLEHLFPFLFPFHQPSVLQGGKAWILELLLKSPVLRQATLCQSSYCFTLARPLADQRGALELLLDQTQDAFQTLARALQVISGGIEQHKHGAARVLASIVQLQRFELSVMNFDNCRAHLDAGMSLFLQLLHSVAEASFACPGACFDAVIDQLGPSSSALPDSSVSVASAEQAAFQFSTALLIFDDIIASTALQEQPRLYELHYSLLAAEAAPIDLKPTLGCHNWVLLRIGEISALDAWKQQLKRAGNLDIVELVRRAMPIKSSVEASLSALETTPAAIEWESDTFLDILNANHLAQSGTTRVDGRVSLITSIWAHAAILYLSIVVSGWQPASDEVRCHVRKSIDLLVRARPPTLLRAVCWPFFVVGSLAEAGQEAQLRNLVHTLQPRSMFGTVYKALEMMEIVWQNRDCPIAVDRDLAACFGGQENLVLLV